MIDALLHGLFVLLATLLGFRFGHLLRPHIYRLAEKWKRWHSRRATAVEPHCVAPHEPGGGGTEGGNMNDKVAQLLGSAAGAADAMADCGVETDDTELVANFISAMDHAHGMFTQGIHDAMEQAKKNYPPDELNDFHTAVRMSMQASPAGTSVWFLWRLASVLKAMASRDVLEAARAVVDAHARWDEAHTPDDDYGTLDTLDAAVKRLLAVMPKEG